MNLLQSSEYYNISWIKYVKYIIFILKLVSENKNYLQNSILLQLVLITDNR